MMRAPRAARPQARFPAGVVTTSASRARDGAVDVTRRGDTTSNGCRRSPASGAAQRTGSPAADRAVPCHSARRYLATCPRRTSTRRRGGSRPMTNSVGLTLLPLISCPDSALVAARPRRRSTTRIGVQRRRARRSHAVDARRSVVQLGSSRDVMSARRGSRHEDCTLRYAGATVVVDSCDLTPHIAQ